MKPLIILTAAIALLGAGCTPRECVESRPEIQAYGFHGWFWLGTNDIDEAREMAGGGKALQRGDRCIKYK